MHQVLVGPGGREVRGLCWMTRRAVEHRLNYFRRLPFTSSKEFSAFVSVDFSLMANRAMPLGPNINTLLLRMNSRVYPLFAYLVVLHHKGPFVGMDKGWVHLQSETGSAARWRGRRLMYWSDGITEQCICI